MDKSELIPYLIIWAAAALLLVWRTWREYGAGLILSYCFQMFLFYWLSGLLHSLPWADLPLLDYVILGAQKSTYAMVSFAFGCVVLAPGIVSRLKTRFHSKDQVASQKLPRLYSLVGVVFFFVVAPTVGKLQGMNAIGSVGAQLVVVGISLNCWRAWTFGGRWQLLMALAPAVLIPVATLTVQGFLSYGVIALSTIMVFTAQFFRPRWLLLVAGIAAGWIGLSGYTAYMKDRDTLRAVIWGGESFSSRIDQIHQTLDGVELFDWNNPEHLEFVDGRLNQSVLVGAAVAYLSNTGNYAHGSTLLDAALGLIPRIIWPSKPIGGGSGGLVNRFTGMDFVDGTSIGIGPVMELYGNFGDMGIWIGFAFLGCLIKIIDAMAGWHLQAGNWYDFATWFLVGISFLNVAGSFVECTAGAIASVVVARAVNTVLRRVDRLSATVPAAA